MSTIDYTRYEGRTEGLRLENGETIKIVDANGGTVATMGFLTRPHRGPRRVYNEVMSTANLFVDAPLILSALRKAEEENKVLREALEMVCADVSTSGMLSFFDDNQEVVSDPKAIADNYITEAAAKIGGSK